MVRQATKQRNRELLANGDIKAIMKALEKAKIKLETREFDNSYQNTYTHETINGPSTWRGYPYSPLSFQRAADQLEQAEKILEREGLI